MKILQMSAYAGPVGGAEIYLHGLADELTRRGHTVGRFGTRPDRAVDEPLVRVVRRAAWDPTRLVRDEAVTGALEDFIRALDPDIIHVHNLYSLALDVDRRLLATGRPVVQTVHDYSVVCPNAWCVHADGTLCEGGAGAKCFAHGCGRNYPFDARLVLITWLRHRLLRALVRVMICPSRYLADVLRNHGFHAVRHVFNYVDAEKLRLPPVAREERRLLYLGRLDPEKGVADLLDALPRIREAEPATRLTVVGEGSQARALRARARRLGLGEAVTFHARVPHEEVKHFYATATLKILPSIWCENSPLTAYECMVAGLPMVGTRIGGIPDLVVDGETGALAEPRDPADLADKVVKLLRAPDERARMAERMRARAKRFTREKNVDQVEAIYREVLAEGPARPGPAADRREDDDLMACLDRLCRDLEAREADLRGTLGHLRAVEARGRGRFGLGRVVRAAAAKLGVRRR